METTRAEKIQLPTQASADAAPAVFLPPAETSSDPFADPAPIADQTSITAQTPVPAAPPSDASDGWGADVLLAVTLLLAVLLVLAVARILRLKETLRMTQADERAATAEARELRHRLAEAAARRAEAARPEAAELAGRVSTLARERDELLRTNRILRGMVRCDTVTGLANGPYLARQLAKELRRAMRTRKVLSLLVCDIDGFASYNRVHGHEHGDELLKRIGALVGARFQRGGDLAARLDADRFAVVMPETPVADAERLAADLERAVREAGIARGSSPDGATVTVSVGVASATSNRLLHPHQLMAAATESLKQARRAAGKAPTADPAAGAEAAAGPRKTAARRTKPGGGPRKAAGTRARAEAAKTEVTKTEVTKTRGGRKKPAAEAPAEEPGVTGTLFPEQAAGHS